MGGDLQSCPALRLPLGGPDLQILRAALPLGFGKYERSLGHQGIAEQNAVDASDER